LLHDAPAEWVIGQIDRRDPGFTNRRLGLQQWEQTHLRYGHPIETGAVGLIQFRGGAQGLAQVGVVSRARPGYRATVYGTERTIEPWGDRPEEGEPWLRARLRGQGDWTVPPVEPNDAIKGEIEALLRVLEEGGTHPLDMRSARAGQELLMAIFESARRRAR